MELVEPSGVRVGCSAGVWHKQRWRCAQQDCSAGTVTEQDPLIPQAREKLTARACRWATRQDGRGGPHKDIAAELGGSGSWHRVNVSVRRWGQALLEADTERISDVVALGLDEAAVLSPGPVQSQGPWGTSIVDVGRGRLLDIVRDTEPVKVLFFCAKSLYLILPKWLSRQQI